MSGINVDFLLGNFPPGFCWQNPQQYANALISLLTGTIGGNFNGVIIGQNTPQLTDQDKLWIKTDSNGRPVGQFLFLGQWIWPHPTPAGSGEDRIWKLSEAALWAYDGGDGTNPATNAPTITTGAMWQRDTDLNFALPVGIGTNPVSYDGNPPTTINPGDTGGAERLLLTQAMLPLFSPALAANTGTDLVWTAVNATGPTKNGPGIGANAVQNAPEMITTPNSYGAATPVSTLNMPPYRGVIFMKRTARQFYTAS